MRDQPIGSKTGVAQRRPAGAYGREKQLAGSARVKRRSAAGYC